MKAAKPTAHYRVGSKDRHCALCTMFRAPHGCTAVAGAISPDGLCDYFKRRRSASLYTHPRSRKD